MNDQLNQTGAIAIVREMKAELVAESEVLRASCSVTIFEKPDKFKYIGGKIAACSEIIERLEGEK